MANKTIYSAEYRHLVQRLRARREEMGITQTALSVELGWPQQRLSAIEAGARRLDVMEFLHLTARLGLTPHAAIGVAVEASQEGAHPERVTKRGK
ncbi:TPA: helix-turn-helix transcriptional regulator [Stenotrophomonas maltophilia]|nr:helix-turn-helix transcriptional regulator [Stenotrophomonas maltophilia]HDX0808019.1 helix-turn-helix transcriptional regulator [Stenotrophomonas maltophilia]HDX0818643.1 helix-turn-helix transcriptional regulator [Stenotrophomonas maltophilia]HDX0832338.1 helix-turn-helix transcriptional regulator [Stenotrophomonas maltophilia]HDX0855981.1 helix-turn-helix transcriptional regulator [Stenotrophomonas maltophilia]